MKSCEAGYRALFENCGDAILLTMADGTILEANPAACEMFERTEKELCELGRRAGVDSSDPRLLVLLRQRETRGDAKGELTLIRKDGTPFQTEVTSKVFRDGSSQAKICMTIRDISARKKMEAESLALNARLEKTVIARTAQLDAANAELSAIGHTVSHDLRAPLRAIEGFSRLLLDEYGAVLDEEGGRLLGVIRGSVARMDMLITDILSLSKIDTAVLRPSRIDMRNMAIAMYHEVAAPEDIEGIIFSVADIPEIEADPALLRIVWANLISNSIKFNAGKGERTISISAETDSEGVRYIVKDNGVGFNMAYAGKLFGLFQRLHSSEAYAGSGAGLAIVKRIAERQGGRVGAEGKEGLGATFWFSLPLLIPIDWPSREARDL